MPHTRICAHSRPTRYRKGITVKLFHRLVSQFSPQTFIGSRIVRLLVENISAPPIICVAYTNHAIDQFGEYLHELGIPLSSIQRLGGRSKSPLFQEGTLYERAEPPSHFNKKIYLEHLSHFSHDFETLRKAIQRIKKSNKILSDEDFRLGISNLCKGYDVKEWPEFKQVKVAKWLAPDTQKVEDSLGNSSAYVDP